MLVQVAGNQIVGWRGKKWEDFRVLGAETTRIPLSGSDRM